MKQDLNNKNIDKNFKLMVLSAIVLVVLFSYTIYKSSTNIQGVSYYIGVGFLFILLILSFVLRAKQEKIRDYFLKKRGLKQENSQIRKIGDCVLDLNKRTCLLNSKPIFLTKVEFDLFLYFIDHKNKVVSRDDILNELWNFDYDGDTRIVDVHLFKLKSKVKEREGELEKAKATGKNNKIQKAEKKLRKAQEKLNSTIAE